MGAGDAGSVVPDDRRTAMQPWGAAESRCESDGILNPQKALNHEQLGSLFSSSSLLYAWVDGYANISERGERGTEQRRQMERTRAVERRTLTDCSDSG